VLSTSAEGMGAMDRWNSCMVLAMLGVRGTTADLAVVKQGDR